MISAERLRELIDYDRNTGALIWRVARGTRKAGTIAGHLNAEGYRALKVDRADYLAHRLIWLLVIGAWPIGQIDHIDGDRGNNRWENLRDVNHSINQQNRRGAQANSRTGVLGVNADKKTFRASIKHNGQMIHIGNYKTTELAHAAYLTAKRELHPGNTL